MTLTDRLSAASPLVSVFASVSVSPHYRGAPFRKSQTSGFSVTHDRTYAYTGDCFPQLHTLLHILQRHLQNQFLCLTQSPLSSQRNLKVRLCALCELGVRYFVGFCKCLCKLWLCSRPSRPHRSTVCKLWFSIGWHSVLLQVQSLQTMVLRLILAPEQVQSLQTMVVLSSLSAA